MKQRADITQSDTQPARAQTAGAMLGVRPVFRAMLLVGVLAAALTIVYLSPIKVWLQDVNRLRQAIGGLGAWAYPVCVLAVALLVACGIPRLAFCMLGGMILGFWCGLLITSFGTTLGYYAVFLFVRWGGRDWVLHRWPKLRKWANLIHEQGIIGVILVRQLPIHGTLVNLCLGLSHAKHRHFLIGTIIGLIPEAAPITLVGAGLVKTSISDSAKYLAIAAVAFAVVWIACGYALRVIRSSRATADLAAEIAAENAEGR